MAAPKKKETIVLDSTKNNYFRCMVGDGPVTGKISNFDDESFDIDFAEDAELDMNDIIPYCNNSSFTNENGKLMITLSNLENILGVSSFKLISYNESKSLQKEYSKHYFKIDSYLAKPKMFGKEQGYTFGCGEVELTEKQIKDYLTVKKLFSDNEQYQNFKDIEEVLDVHCIDNFDSKKLQLLYKRFNIK